MKDTLKALTHRMLSERLKGRIVRMLTEYGKTDEGATPPPIIQIPEAGPMHCRKSSLETPRLNLMLPALSIKYAFGGINTAVDFFMALVKNDADVRIIVTDEVSSDLLALPQANQWKLRSMADEDESGRIIICTGDRASQTLPIRSHDIFVATAWWSAYIAEGVQHWQEAEWARKAPPMVYLVQDYEPGFYKWSSRYAMCLSTYQNKNLITVVNTKLLHDYFVKLGFHFPKHFVFEPMLNKVLAANLSRKATAVKKKQILFYGRPSVDRNAFEILMQGLLLWNQHYPNAKGWRLISLGEGYTSPLPPEQLPIEVRGKVSLEQYADLLLQSALGVSFMVSPHPSYPPLEMAAFDLGVITNSFFNKDLSHFHPSIFSLEVLNPNGVARKLYESCALFEADAQAFSGGAFKKLDFISNHTNYPFITELRDELNLSPHVLSTA